MPTREIPLVTGETYHVLNRGTASVPIFKSKYDYRRFLRATLYYQNVQIPVKFSKLINMAKPIRDGIMKQLKEEKDCWVEINAYCLMPNHYHLLVKQTKDNGIFNFVRRLSSSYSHYFNKKNERKGGLFEGRFKAVRVETGAQLLHLSRYIHLNPYSSFLVNDLESLLDYSFSSLPEYLGRTKTDICQKEAILNQFSNPEDYEKFALDQADYQRSLEEIKHQLLED